MSAPVHSQVQVESSYPNGASSDALLSHFAGGRVIFLIAAACLLLVVKRMRRLAPGGRQAQGLSIVASHAVGQRERLVIVDMQDKRMLIGVTSAQINCLATFEKPEGEGAVAPEASDFHTALNKLLKRGGAGSTK